MNLTTTAKYTTTGITIDNQSSSTPVSVAASAPTVTVLLLGLLATVVALLFLVYYKRRRSMLVNLTKPHKGSEENSYASSEHSHQQGSKYSESPEPGYDVIKPMQTMHRKDKISSPESTHLDINPKHPSEYTSKTDFHYSEISSSHKTTGSLTYSCECSVPSTKDDSLINFKQDVFIVDSEIEKDKDKQKQLTEDGVKCNNNSTKGEASPIPPQTTEMMYTAVQKQPKVNAGMNSEFDDSTPPPPPQTTEMMYIAVQKRPKDSILAEIEDDAPPVPPYMEKENKETEATAKGSDEGSPPPVLQQTTEMLYTAL